MEGDLSLTQSLGGLRIANPDDSISSPSPSATGPSSPPHRSPSSNGSSVVRKQVPRHDLGNASPSRTSNNFKDHGMSPGHRMQMPLNYLDQQEQQKAFNPQYSTPNQPRSGPRPVSGVVLGQGQPPVMPNYNYRGTGDLSTGGQPTVAQRGSRRDIEPGPGPREVYKQGPPPPRRSSKGKASAARQPGRLPSSYIEDAPQSSEEWKERGAATAIRREVDQNGNTVSRYVKKGVKDFNFGQTLGEGSYSTVVAATDRQTLREYAIKVLGKRHIIKEKKVKYVNIEKDTLNRLGDHPGIVRLYYTFQDEHSLYFVLDLASGGELLSVLKRMTTFDEECTKYYGAQILDAVEYMHSKGVIHRDLKPENILLDEKMHVKITDFGTAKILEPPRPQPGENMPLAYHTSSALDTDENNRASSFVGTAEYVSPELLTDKNACKASDLWAFGCIVFQLLSGRPPFKAANEYLTFQKIVALEYDFPKGFPSVARDLIERLLVLDPTKRLPMDHIKSHQFFDGIKWGRSLWKQKAPRLRAYIPPPSEPNIIKLNGANNSPNPNQKDGVSNSPSSGRPPRIITELPPPSQLDIEWSPVLTRSNERILKLGNLNVSVSSPTSPDTSENTKKFTRFFSGGPKKRQRLVIVTSSARIILAAAGGDEKRAKMEIPLLAKGTSWKLTDSSKGGAWCVDTRDRHIIFELPPKSLSSNGGSPDETPSPQDWLDTLERAREIALTQPMSNSFSAEEAFTLSSTLSSPSSTMMLATSHSDRDRDSGDVPNSMTSRGGFLKKVDGSGESKPKRFSKRVSKSGLSAVF